MAFIGNQPISQAFLTDQFSGNGSTTAFTMSVAPATTSSILVAVTGVVQDPSTYSVVGTTLTFSAAPPSGTGNISVRYLGIPASGVTTTAYRTLTEFTATAGQQTFTPPSYTVGFINVYMNGVLLGSADYTAANGTTVVLAAGAVAGALVTTESFYVSSVLNALPQTGGTLAGSLVVTGNTALGDASTDTLNVAAGTLVTDGAGNVGIGTTSPVMDGNGALYVSAINSNGGTFNAGASQSGTANSVGSFQFVNTVLGTADKRIASIGGVTSGATNSGSMVFYTWNAGSGAERARISAAGGFSVGTTADPGAGAIYATGNITAYYTSDRRLKENIKDVDSALDKVCAIGSKTYDWTDEYIASKGGEDGYFVTKADFGVVAQDVQEVFPQAVRTRQDGTLAVDYEKLATLSFGAIKELVKRIEALEAK